MIERMDAEFQRAAIVAICPRTRHLAEWAICWITSVVRSDISIAWIEDGRMEKEILQKSQVQSIQYLA